MHWGFRDRTVMHWSLMHRIARVEQGCIGVQGIGVQGMSQRCIEDLCIEVQGVAVLVAKRALASG